MEELKKSKVCIVGCAHSRDEVPWGDPDMEYWGVNNLFVTPPFNEKPFDRWFEIHPITFDPAKNQWFRRWKPIFRGQPMNEYIQQLTSLKCPVYMQNQWPQIPNSERYPIEDIVQKFGRYFTNTVSYEIALAISMGFKEIHVYGVDMAVGSEYTHQRASCEFFLGIAAGMGIKIFVPGSADLLKTRFLYAYEEQQEKAFGNKLSSILKNLDGQKHILKDRIKADEIKMYQNIGAENAIREMYKLWSNVDAGLFEEVREAPQQPQGGQA